MTTNHFLCLMAGIFLAGTTLFFKDKATSLEKKVKQQQVTIDSLKVKP